MCKLHNVIQKDYMMLWTMINFIILSVYIGWPGEPYSKPSLGSVRTWRFLRLSGRLLWYPTLLNPEISHKETLDIQTSTRSTVFPGTVITWKLWNRKTTFNSSYDFIKFNELCLHFVIMECCRYLVFN